MAVTEADLLEQAVKVLDEHGWERFGSGSKVPMGPPRKVCCTEAIDFAVIELLGPNFCEDDARRLVATALDLIEEHVQDSVVGWNDSTVTGGDEVKGVLKDLAREVREHPMCEVQP